MTEPLLFLRVTARHREADDICSFELAPASGGELPAFTAGSHVDVHVPGGMARQYSLCNSPAERHRYVIGVLREAEGRGGSVALHDRVKVGDPLWVSPPRNHFPLMPGSGRQVLLAGGIGVTPLIAMSEQLHAEGADFELHYCVRTLQRAAFLDRLRQSPYQARVQLHLDDGAPGQRLDLPAVLAKAGSRAQLYVCGPQAFLDFAGRTAAASGFDGQIHSESFVPVRAGSPQDAAFEVELKRSGTVHTVPADKTLLNVLREQGVALPYSCEQGICGACLTNVLEGTPEHRDQYLTDEERARNDQMLPCCSRARSARLVLDL